MRRFVLGWKKLGHERRLKAYIVNYADDLVICGRSQAEEALATMRSMMSKLKLTVNDTKTRVCQLPEEKFDFLGYTFGRWYSPKTGRTYLGSFPSKKRVQRICEAVSLAGAALVSGASHVRVAAGVTVALFGIAFLTFTRRTIESEMLVLKDGKGKPRIAISGEAGMYFFDDNMDVKMMAKVYKEQPAIILQNDKETIIATVTEAGANVTVGKNEASGIGFGTRVMSSSLVLGRIDGTRLMLGATDDEADVALVRRGRSPSLYLKVADAGASASVGEPANVSIQAADDGNVGLVIRNENGETTAVLSSEGRSGQLSFYGDKRRLIAMYPDKEAVKRYMSELAEGSPVPTLPETKAS